MVNTPFVLYNIDTRYIYFHSAIRLRHYHAACYVDVPPPTNTKTRAKFHQCNDFDYFWFYQSKYPGHERLRPLAEQAYHSLALASKAYYNTAWIYELKFLNALKIGFQ